MVGMENPGIQAVDVWRKSEDFTLTVGSAVDNGAVAVTLLNITGRGTWVSIFTQADSDEVITVSHNIDGAGIVTFDIGPNGLGAGNGNPSHGIPINKGFETSLIVQMELAAAGQAWFGAVALVE